MGRDMPTTSAGVWRRLRVQRDQRSWFTNIHTFEADPEAENNPSHKRALAFLST